MSNSSKLSQRFLGLPTRIYLIIGLFLALIFLTHLFLPSNSIPHQRFSNANLTPKNYLNISRAENPFPFCPNYGPGDELGAKYGKLSLEQSRLHLGSGIRVRRVLERAMAGLPVTISVIGASVSACHGAGDDPIAPQCYPSRFFQWWNTVFPNPASELTNGAMRRANSAYYGFCSSHHIPDATDLIIVELDAADIPNEESRDHFELLIRSLLLRPSAPAVLLLGHFAPQIIDTYGFAGSDQFHGVVAQFYDVPHVSTKSSLYSAYMSSPSAVAPYFVDPVLASPQGHALLSDTLAAYFQSQICATWDALPSSSLVGLASGGSGSAGGLFGGVGLRKGVPPEEGGAVDGAKPAGAGGALSNSLLGVDPQAGVPSALISTRPTGKAFQEIAPFCAAANDLINPLPPSLFYGSGWIGSHPEVNGPGTDSLTSHYWSSTLPTSKLRVPIKVGAGDIGVYYVLEPVSSVGEGSAIECWVDDNYAGAKVLENAADVGEPIAKLEMIDHFVARGSHYVECQLLGEEGQAVPPFKIVGIFAT